MFSKSSIKPYGLDFFENFSGLEISAKKNTAFKISHQNEKSLKNLWKMHFSKKKNKIFFFEIEKRPVNP